MVHTKNLHNVKMKIQSGGGDDPGYIEKTTDVISNVHGSIKSNPHISLFLLFNKLSKFNNSNNL